jgi:hypothetical protein
MAEVSSNRPIWTWSDVPDHEWEGFVQWLKRMAIIPENAVLDRRGDVMVRVK